MLRDERKKIWKNLLININSTARREAMKNKIQQKTENNNNNNTKGCT